MNYKLIFFLEMSCISSGKTSCTGSSNCWLYDTEKLRYTFNLTAASKLNKLTSLNLNDLLFFVTIKN